MKPQSNEDVNNLVVKIINTVDEYYDSSFRVRNDRCSVILLKLIEQLEDLLQLVHDTGLQLALQDTLNIVANAMAEKDYVRIRDLLHYELRGKLNKLN